MDPDGNEVKQDVAAKIGFGIPEGFSITAVDENQTESPLTAEDYGRVWVAEYDLSKPNEIISNGNAILTKPGTENRGDDEHHDLSDDSGVYVDDPGEEGNDMIDE